MTLNCWYTISVTIISRRYPICLIRATVTILDRETAAIFGMFCGSPVVSGSLRMPPAGGQCTSIQAASAEQRSRCTVHSAGGSWCTVYRPCTQHRVLRGAPRSTRLLLWLRSLGSLGSCGSRDRPSSLRRSCGVDRLADAAVGLPRGPLLYPRLC